MISMSVKWTFRVRGFGSPVLLLHGYGGSPRHWESLSLCLEPHFQVTTLNLSHLYFADDVTSLEAQVHVLHQFVLSHFNEPVKLVGFSYGGALAWAYKLLYPEAVSDLVLLNPLLPDPIKFFRSWELRLLFRLDLTVRKLGLILKSPVGNIYLRRLEDLFRFEGENPDSRLRKLSGRKMLLVINAILRFQSLVKSENWQKWLVRIHGRGTLAKSLLIYGDGDSLFEAKSYLSFVRVAGIEHTFKLEGKGHMAPHQKPIELSKILHYYFRYSDSLNPNDESWQNLG